MRKLLFLLIIPCLFVSCSFNAELNPTYGTFNIGRSIIMEKNDFSCLIISDIHFGRSGKGIYQIDDDLFFNWLLEQQQQLQQQQQQIDFAINLGDISDHNNNSEFQSYESFAESISSTLDWGDDRIFEVIGNHDIKNDVNSDRTPFVEATGEHPYGIFTCSDITFYRLDTAARSLGKVQLSKLSDAVKSNEGKKIFLGHYPLHGFVDVYTYFALSNPLEINTILSLMVNNNCPLYLCGHNHNGFADIDFGNNVYQDNLSAFNGSTSRFENCPIWYIAHYNYQNEQITIQEYRYEDDDIKIGELKTFNF